MSNRLETFSCDDVGLTCDPNVQADSFLLPWCCTQNYVYIISVIDTLADRRVWESIGSELGGPESAGL